jgi:hypothetical protein
MFLAWQHQRVMTYMCSYGSKGSDNMPCAVRPSHIPYINLFDHG